MKNVIKRIITSASFGISIGYICAIISSILLNGSVFFLTYPTIVEKCGSELNAVIFQTFLYAITGIICGLSSYIYEIDKINLASQTVLHFLITFISVNTLSTLLNNVAMIDLTINNFIFIIIYVIIWIIMYIKHKRIVKMLNKNLNKEN